MANINFNIETDNNSVAEFTYEMNILLFRIFILNNSNTLTQSQVFFTFLIRFLLAL